MNKITFIVFMFIAGILLATLFSGCMNYRKVTNTSVTTFRPDFSIEHKAEKVIETDNGFTIGSKGLGEYHFIEASFM